MVRLKDVAAACGLSVTQVSRALNGKSDVNPDTRDMVVQKAAEIGYVKNLNAQSLSAKQSSQIAVIVRGLSQNGKDTTFIIDTIRGINKFASQNDFETVVHFVEHPPDSYENYCRQRGVGGMVIFNISYKEPAFTRLMESDFPCVTIDIPIEGRRKGCVVINNTYYASLAVQQLINAGRKKIALIGGNEQSFVEVERRSGYELALRQAGIEPLPGLFANGYYDHEGARQAALLLLQANPDIDGLFCMSDTMAVGALAAACSLGYSVPKQLSIFGFDGFDVAEYARPAISTIAQDNLKKGYLAAKLLTDILRGKQETGTVVVPCELRLRSSV